MPIGFQVINDFGSYQIDDYYQNLFLDNKYTIDKRRLIKNPNSNFYYHDLVFTSDTPPVVAVGVYDNINTACYGMKQVGNQYTAKIATSSNTQDIDIYVFNTLNGSSSTYGLQVFDENGKLIFDALKKPLRLVSIQNQNSKSTPMLESGRKYAVCHNRHFTHKVFTHIDVMNVGRYGGWQPHLGVAGSFLDLEIMAEYMRFFSSVRKVGQRIDVSDSALSINYDDFINIKNGGVVSGSYSTWLDVETKLIEFINKTGYAVTDPQELELAYMYIIDTGENTSLLPHQYMIVDVTNY